MSAGDLVPITVADLGLADRIAALQAQAKALAREHIGDLGQELARLQALALEVSEGGDVYPAGVRDVASRIADRALTDWRTLTALMERRP